MQRQTDRGRLWRRYMEVERRELEDRKSGELARALGPALAGESQDRLNLLAREDREKAEEGLVGLKEGDEVYYKHIDELSPEDRPARIEAQRERLAWIQRRLAAAAAEEGDGPAEGSRAGD